VTTEVLVSADSIRAGDILIGVRDNLGRDTWWSKAVVVGGTRRDLDRKTLTVHLFGSTYGPEGYKWEPDPMWEGVYKLP
jgi:hypothetical protein